MAKEGEGWDPRLEDLVRAVGDRLQERYGPRYGKLEDEHLDQAIEQELEGRPWLSPYLPSAPEAILAFFRFIGLTESDVLLDVGCGDGRVLVTAAKAVGCRGIGVDVSQACIDMARETATSEGVSSLTAWHCLDATAPGALESLQAPAAPAAAAAAAGATTAAGTTAAAEGMTSAAGGASTTSAAEGETTAVQAPPGREPSAAPAPPTEGVAVAASAAAGAAGGGAPEQSAAAPADAGEGADPVAVAGEEARRRVGVTPATTTVPAARGGVAAAGAATAAVATPKAGPALGPNPGAAPTTHDGGEGVVVAATTPGVRAGGGAAVGPTVVYLYAYPHLLRRLAGPVRALAAARGVRVCSLRYHFEGWAPQARWSPRQPPPSPPPPWLPPQPPPSRPLLLGSSPGETGDEQGGTRTPPGPCDLCLYVHHD